MKPTAAPCLLLLKMEIGELKSPDKSTPLVSSTRPSLAAIRTINISLSLKCFALAVVMRI
jgi:hypothetical protein